MNRKQKIIVSVVGITIVLLALLGITYAYYLTRIEGNTNTNSISITTADLKLEYSDGNGIVEKANFMPGESITKTFSVENTGENKVTGYTIVLEDVVNELSRREDLKYSLYCTLDNGTSCGKSEDNLYPKTSNIAIIYANDIESKIKHNYELVVNYIYLDNIDQSDDMGSTISGKINIYDAKDDKLNPFKTGVSATDNKSLAYNIIENARLGKNGTTLTGTPLTKVAEEINLEDEKVLATTQDDYGISYYFRGNVEDNYVNFAGMCWKIVRINGDGSIKLILEDKNTFCNADDYTGNWVIGSGNYGYGETTIGNKLYFKNYLEPVSNANNSMVKYFYDFQNSFLYDYLDKLESGAWCLANTIYETNGVIDNLYNYKLSSSSYLNETPFYYDSYVRLAGDNINGYFPTLKCTGNLINEFEKVLYNEDIIIESIPMYVSAITADEVIFAGAKVHYSNPNYFLINDFQKNNNIYWWTLSSYAFNGEKDQIFDISIDGNINDGISNGSDSFRPLVNLKSGITISTGDGTIDNPYVIE